MNFVRLLRPTEWIKNLAVLPGPILSLRLFEAQYLGKVAVAFVAFSLASSASYAINDTIDRHADALHPAKRRRPVASGDISPIAALLFAGVLITAALLLCTAALPRDCSAMVACYFVLILAYSLALKKRMILDVLVIAVGFVLRASGGAHAVDAPISPWLIVCTFTVCMFLGFGKRRCELATFNSVEEAREHRGTLIRYTPELLNHLISVSAGIAIVTFLLYTMDRSPERQPPFHKEYLLYTLPLVTYGVFRYAMLIESGRLSGPTDIMLRDRPLLGTILLWSLIAVAIVFAGKLRPLLGL